MRVLVAVVAVIVVALSLGQGAYAESFSVSGTVWEDKNADGVHQPSEPGVGFVSIELGKITNGVAVFKDERGLPLFRDADGRGVRPDDSGRYSFPNLEPGNYVVRIPIGAGGNVFFMTHPVRRGFAELGTSVRIESQSLSGVDFGLYVPTTDIMRLRGLAWVDGTPAHTEVANESIIHAFIDGVDCTGPGGILPTDQARGSFTLGVVAESLVAGCGAPGREVHFEIEGRPANETVIWESRPSTFQQATPGGRIGSLDRLELTAGPAFAYLRPQLIDSSGRDIQSVNEILEAAVDGVSCGRVFGGPFFSYTLTVPSTDFSDGCGYMGALIHLRLDGSFVGPSIPWKPGFIDLEPIVVSQSSEVSNQQAGIRPPNAGDAGLAERGRFPYRSWPSFMWE